MSFRHLPYLSRDKEFIHQLVVDSYAAQHSGPKVKPISTVFALIGLYLTFEHGYTGKEVQRAHMEIAKTRRLWPRFNPPPEKGKLTVRDALQGINKVTTKIKLTPGENPCGKCGIPNTKMCVT